MNSYAIIDEPKPTAMAHLAVQPVWPLFAVMFGGSWLSWPWFAFNAFAVGSPTKWKELGAVCVGFVGKLLIAFGLIALFDAGVTSQETGFLALIIALDVWKIAVSYWLYITQDRTIELFKYTGGKLRNGIILVVAGFYINQRLLPWIIKQGLFVMVLTR